MWWTTLVNFLTRGIVEKAIGALVAAKQSDATVDVEAIRAATDAARAQADIVKAEQGSFLTRLVRPAFAAPFVIYTWKLVVWDKVLGWGSTDPLGADLSALMVTIVGAYFGGRTIELVAARFARGR